MIPILTTILPALLPAVTDGFGQLFKKITGFKDSVSVEDRVKLINADTERLKALAEIDKPNANISVWVANLRGSFRYILAGLVVFFTLIISLYAIIYMPDSRPQIIGRIYDLGSSAFFFSFGDRVYRTLKKEM